MGKTLAYTFLDLKTKLTTQIGDPNLDSSVMGDALNYTQQSIFGTFDITLNSGQQTNSVTVGTNTLTTALPTDLERISSMYITAPAGLAQDITDYYVSPKDFRANYPSPTLVGASSPGTWTLWTSVEFANTANLTYTLVIDYIKATTIMSGNADIPTIPQAYEELLMLGAKMRIYEQKEDFDYANQYTNRYADLLEAFTTRYSTRQVDKQVVIPGARRRG